MTHRWLRLAMVVHLFLFALVVGVFWGTWLSLARSMASISAATFLEVGHTMIANLGGPMAALLPGTLLSAVPILLGLYRRRSWAAAALTAVGAALLIAALVITLGVNVPIDGAIAGWTVDTLPSDWRATRARWAAWHTARTWISLVGFGSALAALAVVRDDPSDPR